MFQTTITPRVSETDGAGHINNVFVPIWFEAGRREIFKILNPDLGFADWHAILVNITVDYEEQIYFQHDAEVRTWIERIGNKSFTVGEEIWQQGKRCAQGRAVYVYFNSETQAADPVPADIADQLRRHMRDR